MFSRSWSDICENLPPRSTRAWLLSRKRRMTDCSKQTCRFPSLCTRRPVSPSFRQRRMVRVETLSFLANSSSVISSSAGCSAAGAAPPSASMKSARSWRRSAPGISRSGYISGLKSVIR